MSYRKYLVIPAFLAALALAPAMSLAQHHEGGEHGSKSEMDGHDKHGDHDGKWSEEKAEKMGKRMAKKLGLSDEQKKQMKAIHEKAREEHKALREEIKEAPKAMRQAMKDPKTSEGELKKRHKALRQIMQKQGDIKFEKMLKIRKILNPEQLEKFTKMAGKHHKGKDGGWDHRKKKGGKDGHGCGAKKCDHKNCKYDKTGKHDHEDED